MPFFLRTVLFAVAVSVLTACSSDRTDPAADTSNADAAADESDAQDPTTSTVAAEAPSTTTTPPTTTEAPPPELQIIGHGEFDVGVTTLVIEDDDRPLTVDVWFPLADGRAGAAQQYTLLAGIYYESPIATAAEPADISTDGPFPLIAYSHGSGGLRYIHSDYTETLASHGYVVVAPDHTGNTALERLLNNADPVDVIAANRPRDISRVLDAFLDGAHPTAGAFTSSIDADLIAVTGHSFGGYTSYALVAGVDTANGEIAADDRIDAIIALAPATGAGLLSDERLAAVTVPSMIIVGSDDKTTPIDDNVTRPWDLVPGTPAYRVELQAGEHQTFTDICEYLDFMPTLGTVPDAIIMTLEDFGKDGCLPEDMPTDRALDLTATFALNFLDEVFNGGGSVADGAAIPDDVVFLTK